MYLTTILEVQYFQIRLHNDDSEVGGVMRKQTNTTNGP